MQCVFRVFCIIFINFSLVHVVVLSDNVGHEQVMKSLVKVHEMPENCTPPSIDDFPSDLFTQDERRQGYVAIHFIASFYMFYCLALVCQDYFVPCIECCCEGLLL